MGHSECRGQWRRVRTPEACQLAHSHSQFSSTAQVFSDIILSGAFVCIVGVWSVKCSLIRDVLIFENTKNVSLD